MGDASILGRVPRAVCRGSFRGARLAGVERIPVGDTFHPRNIYCREVSEASARLAISA